MTLAHLEALARAASASLALGKCRWDDVVVACEISAVDMNEAEKAYAEALAPATVLALLRVVKAGELVMSNAMWSPTRGTVVLEHAIGELRAALAALNQTIAAPSGKEQP